MTQHDISEQPQDKEVPLLYVNEPWVIDISSPYYTEPIQEQTNIDTSKDNIRVYVPLDLSSQAILRRLDYIINVMSEAAEDNEFEYEFEVNMIVTQLEIYDQLWLKREKGEPGAKHSKKGKALAKKFVAHLERIGDDCFECFPTSMIDELEEEYALRDE